MTTTDFAVRDLLAHQEALEQEAARRHLVNYALRCIPGYQAPIHIQYIAGLLEQAERGELPRLAISFAPGHGKSTILQAFVSWFIGRQPRRRVLALSATEDLANRNSIEMRSMIQSEKWPWPNVVLEGKALTEWRTNYKGGVRAIGQTGTVTGFRAEMILCDDVQPDAGTETTRQGLEDWFRGVLTTRLEPNAIVVVIQTRWHDDDLIGRLEAGESKDQWKFVNIPAIAGDNDILGRAKGEALWPQRWPVELLLKKKEEIFALPFESQYQGDPVPAEGRVFKEEWFKHRYDRPPECKFKIISIDSAWKEGPANDYTVIATWGTDGTKFYLLDILRGKWELPNIQRNVIAQYAEHRPNVVVVEEKQSGIAILQQLRANTSIPIIGINPKGDKRSRAEAITPIFDAQKVVLPNGASWLDAWLFEHQRFDAGKHDDQVDTTSMALDYMTRFVVARQQIDYARYRNYMER